MTRRTFIKNSCLAGAAVALSPSDTSTYQEKTLKISLAQWSLHRSFQDKTLNPVDFAAIARETYQLDAIEYVNSFYSKQANNEKFWNDMKARSEKAGVKNLVIMVDEEGDLGDADKAIRLKSVENHYKWVNAAKLLGCPTVRVNAFGDADQDIFRQAIIDSMSRLAEYAAQEDINIVIENHGLFSSDAALIAGIIKEVNLPNFGSFPDFGNWCLSAKWGSTQEKCEQAYDTYQGVKELLPYAKAVSAKSYNFNANGEVTKIDYYRLMKLVKESDYSGYIGIEYEGTEKSEHEGILLTKALMTKAWHSASSN